MATMHFAVWYSTTDDVQALREALPAPGCERHFLQDFGFAQGYADDAIALWYGATPGEKGSIHPHNPALDPHFAFLTRAAGERPVRARRQRDPLPVRAARCGLLRRDRILAAACLSRQYSLLPAARFSAAAIGGVAVLAQQQRHMVVLVGVIDMEHHRHFREEAGLLV